MFTIYGVLSHFTIFCCKIIFLRFTLFCREICFGTIYTLLRGDKMSQKLCLWRKKDKYEVCVICEQPLRASRKWCQPDQKTSCPLVIQIKIGKFLLKTTQNANFGRKKSPFGGSANILKFQPGFGVVQSIYLPQVCTLSGHILRIIALSCLLLLLHALVALLL